MAEEDETSQEVEKESLQKLGLGHLLMVLLSPRTFPHLLLLILVSSILYSYVTRASDGGVFTAMVFISFSLSYALIALSARSEKWKDLVNTTAFKETGSTGLSAWLMHQLQQLVKVWIPPLLIATLVIAALLGLFADGRPLERWASGLPLLLAGLFIGWSIGQAISYRMTIKGFLIGRPALLNSGSRNPHLLSSSLLQIGLVQALGVLLLWLMKSAAAAHKASLGDVLKEHYAYLLVLAAGQIGVLVWARPARDFASRTKGGARSAISLGLAIQMFAAWHLLSIWRRLSDFGEPEMVSTIEELTLMILTVILAIYGLSSRSLQVENQYFNEQNALFWGLSFGFGYAGSISMITILLNDVGNVLMFGHLITYLTLLYLHRSSLQQLPWDNPPESESPPADQTTSKDAEENEEAKQEAEDEILQDEQEKAVLDESEEKEGEEESEHNLESQQESEDGEEIEVIDEEGIETIDEEDIKLVDEEGIETIDEEEIEVINDDDDDEVIEVLD